MNKPGAASKIGADYVKRSPADGYTPLVIHSGIMANAFMYKSFDLDLRKDFTYIVPLTWTPWVVAINDALPVRTMADLIAYGKAHPGALNFGTTGGTSELDVRILMQKAGIDGELLLYPGGTDVMTALARNDIQVALNAIRGVESLRGKGVKGIAVTAIDKTYGKWQYATKANPAESDWTDMDAGTAVSDSSALLLKADATTRIRMISALTPHHEGTPAQGFIPLESKLTSGITFRAWDQTTGTAGQRATVAQPGLVGVARQRLDLEARLVLGFIRRLRIVDDRLQGVALLRVLRHELLALLVAVDECQLRPGRRSS